MESYFTPNTPKLLLFLANEAYLFIEGHNMNMARQGGQNKQKDKNRHGPSKQFGPKLQ